MNANSFCTLRVGLTDRGLARRSLPHQICSYWPLEPGPDGALFLVKASGLGRLEAQVAGTPVVAPAYAGSQDAYVDQVTGSCSDG